MIEELEYGEFELFKIIDNSMQKNDSWLRCLKALNSVET